MSAPTVAPVIIRVLFQGAVGVGFGVDRRYSAFVLVNKGSVVVPYRIKDQFLVEEMLCISGFCCAVGVGFRVGFGVVLGWLACMLFNKGSIAVPYRIKDQL